MKAESIVYALAGMCFGIILGWVIAVQQPQPAATAQAPAAAPATGQPASPAAAQQGQAPQLDEARVQGLMTIISNDDTNAEARVQLANTYFDAERYAEAIKWYEDALKLDPKNVDASTDLGVSYYYANQPDRALQQFDYSLSLDPRHTKTMLNQGIVKAFGKQDLPGAIESWQQVVKLAPESPEGQAAQRALETMKQAHPGAPPGS